MDLPVWTDQPNVCHFCEGSGLREDEVRINRWGAWECERCGHNRADHRHLAGQCFVWVNENDMCCCGRFEQKRWGRKAAIEHTKEKS